MICSAQWQHMITHQSQWAVRHWGAWSYHCCHLVFVLFPTKYSYSCLLFPYPFLYFENFMSMCTSSTLRKESKCVCTWLFICVIEMDGHKTTTSMKSWRISFLQLTKYCSPDGQRSFGILEMRFKQQPLVFKQPSFQNVIYCSERWTLCPYTWMITVIHERQVWVRSMNRKLCQMHNPYDASQKWQQWLDLLHILSSSFS